MIASNFLWFPWLSHRINEGNVHIAHGVVVFLFLLTVGILYRLSLKSIDQEIVPDGKVSVKNVFQAAIEGLLSIMRRVIPHHTEDYFPLLGTIFIYILVSNLLGLIPGFLPPTENISTNFAVALTVFVYYHAVGIKRQGLKHYLVHFAGPSLGEGIGMKLLRFGFFAPLMIVIELISHSVRPLSLSLRLFGNINGDHMVLKAFESLAPAVVPVVFLAFGAFVALIQAFVFTVLSTIYVGLAVETHEE